jgi:hypothetical protein
VFFLISMANTEKQHKQVPGAVPDEVRAPLTAEARALLAGIEKKLPAWRRRAILRAAIAWGLKEVDQRPADALREFGR